MKPRSTVCLLALVAASVLLLRAQPPQSSRLVEWLYYGNDQAGTRYSIRVDNANNNHEGYLKLLWYSPDSGQRAIPTSQLYPS